MPIGRREIGNKAVSNALRLLKEDSQLVTESVRRD
jgi:hypothetical protein